MRPSDLHTGAAQLRDAAEELQTAWADAAELWSDGVSRRFCEMHLEPIGPVVKQALDAVSRMSQLADQIRCDCDE